MSTGAPPAAPEQTLSSPGEQPPVEVAPAEPRRRSKAPWIVLAVLALLGGSAGAVLAMGLVPGVPGLFKTKRRTQADAGAASASATAGRADAGASTSSLEPLAGAWVGNGHELDAVLVGGDLEFRVKKPDQFPRQNYEVGDARFVLRATSDAGVFAVEDRIRPVPPTGKTYDARSRGTCQEVWTSAGAEPLRARYDGTRLSVEFAKIEPGAASFLTEGTKVTSCVRLHDLKASKVVSVLTRP
jgi:serine/threonine-protein kinase